MKNKSTEKLSFNDACSLLTQKYGGARSSNLNVFICRHSTKKDICQQILIGLINSSFANCEQDGIYNLKITAISSNKSIDSSSKTCDWNSIKFNHNYTPNSTNIVLLQDVNNIQIYDWGFNISTNDDYFVSGIMTYSLHPNFNVYSFDFYSPFILPLALSASHEFAFEWSSVMDITYNDYVNSIIEESVGDKPISYRPIKVGQREVNIDVD